MRFFEQLPIIEYNKLNMRNIMLKTAFIKEAFNKRDAYYPYIIQDGERPDTIAYDYYGDSNYAWIVYFSNDIIDPYYDWPLDYRDFNSFIQKKYDTTVDQTKNTIKHYEYTGIGGNIETEEDVARKSWVISPENWSYLSADERSGWTPVYVYDWEHNLNESKRSIRLLDKIYLSQIKNELEVVFRD